MNKTPEIVKTLIKADKASQITEDLKGRVLGAIAGVVTENNDPENLRRIKVEFPEFEGVNSYWLYRLHDSPLVDEPLPRIGDTVLISFIDADISKGFYQVIQNKANQPFNKTDSKLDYYRSVEGKVNYDVIGKRTVNVEDELEYKIIKSRKVTANSNEEKIATSNKVTSLSYDNKVDTIAKIEAGASFLVDAGATVNIASKGITNIASIGATAIGGSALAFTASSGAVTLATPGFVSSFGGAGGVWDVKGNALKVQTQTALFNTPTTAFNSNSLSQKGEQLASINMVKDYVLSVTGKGNAGASILWGGGNAPNSPPPTPNGSKTISGFKKIIDFSTPFLPTIVADIKNDIGDPINLGFELEIDDLLYIHYQFEENPRQNGCFSMAIANSDLRINHVARDTSNLLTFYWVNIEKNIVRFVYPNNANNQTLKIFKIMVVRL